LHTIWTGARVRLRPFKDETEWCELHEAEHLVPNDFWGAWWTSRQEMKKDFEPAGMLATEKYSVFAVERLDTGQLVGYEEHGPPAPGAVTAWVGTFILPEHWHHGFGIEAKQLCYCYLFESYPILSVESATLSCHKRAARGLHGSGMSFEGRVRAFHYRDGVFHDLVCYRISREQWEQHPIRSVVQRG
jgi:RimJ/RimL family protein N-acetyltransferase